MTIPHTLNSTQIPGTGLYRIDLLICPSAAVTPAAPKKLMIQKSKS